jgi:enamine deaminase RidA (YjgF/YER057c/UK114 family)
VPERPSSTESSPSDPASRPSPKLPENLHPRVSAISADYRRPPAADAQPDQVTKITIFVVGYRRDECLPTIEEGRVALFGDHKPADTLVGVEALSPGYLIEVEAIAVVDG